MPRLIPGVPAATVLGGPGGHVAREAARSLARDGAQCAAIGREGPMLSARKRSSASGVSGRANRKP